MNPARDLLILAVRFYRYALSPIKNVLFGPFGHCRFQPSCSQYALQALQTHGAMKGTWLAAKRLARCHPWGDFGHDPVPPRSTAPEILNLDSGKFPVLR